MNRDGFINKLLKYASSAERPDDCISHMLESIGAEFDADRAYVFELNEEGGFDSTFEWTSEGVIPFSNVLKAVSFDGLLEIWYNEFLEKGYVYVNDLKQYQEIAPKIYPLLKQQNVNTFVIWPMFLNELCIGFFGIDNPPAGDLENIKALFQLVGYFLATMIRYRNNIEKLERLSYEDHLTGVMNRHALDIFSSENYGKLKSIGILSLDINGLKAANDTMGHEAGDRLIVDVSESLIIVFGKKNVYRIGGDEFIVVFADGDKEEFTLKISQATQLMRYKGVDIASGYTFKENTDKTIVELLKEVDEKMYEDKARFYADEKNERRRRQR